jgi:hypothetical protein
LSAWSFFRRLRGRPRPGFLRSGSMASTGPPPRPSSRGRWRRRCCGSARAGHPGGRAQRGALSPVYLCPSGSLRSFGPPGGGNARRVQGRPLPVDLDRLVPRRSSRASCGVGPTHPPRATLIEAPPAEVIAEPHPTSTEGASARQWRALEHEEDAGHKAARSSRRGLPPLGLGGSSGNRGSITSHSSSVTSGLAISLPYPLPGFVRRI